MSSKIIYLYVKQHAITGLKYFGVTTNQNPFKYPGSGVYWLKHIRKHQRKYVETIELWGFDDQNICSEFAITFSVNNNIVESNEWANLMLETGIPSSDKQKLICSRTHTKKVVSNESRRRMSIAKKNDPFQKERCRLASEKAAISNSGTHWWTDGHINIKSKEQPGSEFVRGRSLLDKNLANHIHTPFGTFQSCTKAAKAIGCGMMQVSNYVKGMIVADMMTKKSRLFHKEHIGHNTNDLGWHYVPI